MWNDGNRLQIVEEGDSKGGLRGIRLNIGGPSTSATALPPFYELKVIAGRPAWSIGVVSSTPTAAPAKSLILCPRTKIGEREGARRWRRYHPNGFVWCKAPLRENVMTARQHAANRSNATKSTGPRTSAVVLVRLTAEDLRDPRRRPARASALRESWEAVERHLRAAGWRFSCVSPGVPIAPTQTAVLEAGDGDDRRVLVVCPGRAVYDLRFRRAGGEQWAAAAGGSAHSPPVRPGRRRSPTATNGPSSARRR